MTDLPDSTPVARGPVLLMMGKLFLGLLAGLALFDVGLGLYESDVDLRNDRLQIPDELLGWTNRPDFRGDNVTTNSLGLRSPEIPPDAPPEEVRILGVGASRIFGAGQDTPDIEGSWSQVLQAALERNPGGPWRVLNGGVAGYSVVQSARRATLLLDSLRPDLVLIAVSPGRQSLLDPSQAQSWVHFGDEGELVPRSIVDFWPPALVPAALAVHHLMLHSNLYTRWYARTEDEGEVEERLRNFVLSRAPHGDDIDAMLQRTFDELSALQRACDQRGVELRALLFLEGFMDSDARWQKYLRNCASRGAPPMGTPRREPVAVLGETLDGLGIGWWSFFDEITLIGTDHDRFTADGVHWKAPGHRVIARGMYEELLATGLADALRARRAGHPRE